MRNLVALISVLLAVGAAAESVLADDTTKNNTATTPLGENIYRPSASPNSSPSVVSIFYSGDESSTLLSSPQTLPKVPQPPHLSSQPLALDSESATSTAPSVVTQTIRYWNTSSALPGKCTGCVLEAYNPITTFYRSNDTYSPWTSLVVTETIITQFVTYMYNGTIDTITSELRTVNQTKTAVLADTNQTITHSTPTFVIRPTLGVELQVDAGPTYVVYNKLIGGLDKPYDKVIGRKILHSCGNDLTSLTDWKPTKSEDWSSFIATYTGTVPDRVYGPMSIPSKLIDFLKYDPDIEEQFHGSDIATCTLLPTPLPSIGLNPGGSRVPAFTALPLPAFPHLPSVSTGIFLSTVFASTSTHVTRQGCLRCIPTKPFVPPKQTEGRVTDGLHGNPSPTPQPIPDPNPNRPGDSVTIGNEVFPITIPSPPQHNSDNGNNNDNNNNDNSNGNNNVQNGHENNNSPPPLIIIGHETFHPGETKTINNLPVIAPSNNADHHIMVNGHTISYSPPTDVALLTLDSTTLTANPQGEFTIGSATLVPGGPAIVVSGTTLSLAPSAVAVINGVTQTLGSGSGSGTAPTAAAAGTLTLADGHTIIATSLHGTPAYILAPGQTLVPGNPLTISGTIYSFPTLPPDSPSRNNAIIIVANGRTTTLSPPAAITPAPAAAAPLTVNGHVYPATIHDGTVEYILAAGVTLTRGGNAVTMSDGAVLSLEPGGTALVVNGKTSGIESVAASVTGNGSGSGRSGDSSGKEGSSKPSTAGAISRHGPIPPAGQISWKAAISAAAVVWFLLA